MRPITPRMTNPSESLVYGRRFLKALRSLLALPLGDRLTFPPSAFSSGSSTSSTRSAPENESVGTASDKFGIEYPLRPMLF